MANKVLSLVLERLRLTLFFLSLYLSFLSFKQCHSVQYRSYRLSVGLVREFLEVINNSTQENRIMWIKKKKKKEQPCWSSKARLY